MSIISIFNGIFCNEGQVISNVLSKTGYKLITDDDIIALAVKISGVDVQKIKTALSAKTSVFNRFTHEKERSVSCLKRAIAEVLSDHNLLSDHKLLINGFCMHLIPQNITHVLKVCLIAETKSRIAFGCDFKKISEKEAANIIHTDEEERIAWVSMVHGKNDPWDPAFYDIVIPMLKTDVEKASDFIIEKASDAVLKPNKASQNAVNDFLLASNVQVALANQGHHVDVSANDGNVIITINKQVLMLNRLEEELKSVAIKISGVKSVETKVGKGYHQADIYRKYNFEMPSRVLLVDDEREFVQTLSERLLMRNMGSAVVYDGESALNMVKDDEPEVMILDLKMPGIDGIEVLKRVKQTRPEIEVIILTGHGSDADKQVCMDLGAFAYLQKPVDINILSETLKLANEAIQKRQQNKK